MTVKVVALSACVAVIVTSTAACNSETSVVSGFPGLAIKATCPTGSTSAKYQEVEGKYPGERASADPVGGRFLADIGELPLPCVARGSAYRIYQSNDSGAVVIGVSQSGAGARLWVNSRAGGRGKIRRAERSLLKTEWDRIVAQIMSLGFWTQPARLVQPNREEWRGGWTLEGYSGDRYHRVSRFDFDDSLRPIADAFLNLARPLFAKAD